MEAGKFATRVYTKRRFGAHPEVDQHILQDTKATNPRYRYYACESYHRNLAAARDAVVNCLHVPHENKVTEVHYIPPTGWHTTKGKSTAITQGAEMTNAIPTEPRTRSPNKFPRGQAPKGVPTGYYAEALRQLGEWTDKTPPTDPVELAAYQKEGVRLHKKVSSTRIKQLSAEARAKEERAATKQATKAENATHITTEPKPSAAPAGFMKVKVIDDVPVLQKRFTVNMTSAAGNIIAVDVFNYEDLDHLMGSIKKHNF